MRSLTFTLIASLTAALVLAACGSSSAPDTATVGNPAAAQAVQRALAATQKRSYRESFTEDITLNTSDLPSAEAARLNSVGGTIVGSAQVMNQKNFQIVVTLHGVKVYVRGMNGHLSTSEDGTDYQPAPATTAKLFSQLVSLGPGILGHVQDAKALGSAEVSGQAVNRYSAIIPGNAVSPIFSTLNVHFGSPGSLHFVIEVSRSSGLPVRVSDDESSSFDLSKLHRPGVTGSFSVKVTSVRNFIYR